jgi:hypothetical protein
LGEAMRGHHGSRQCREQAEAAGKCREQWFHMDRPTLAGTAIHRRDVNDSYPSLVNKLLLVHIEDIVEAEL